jgi:hypothetical protein
MLSTIDSLPGPAAVRRRHDHRCRRARTLPAGPHAGLFSEMRWRNIGPLRAGRTKAMAGVASQPFTFYSGW